MDDEAPERVSLNSVIVSEKGASQIKQIYIYFTLSAVLCLMLAGAVIYFEQRFFKFLIVLVILAISLFDRAEKLKQGRFSKIQIIRVYLLALIIVPLLVIVPSIAGGTSTELLASLIICSPIFALCLWGAFIFKSIIEPKELNDEIAGRGDLWKQYREWLYRE